MPLKLSAQDAVTSSGRGVVYLVIIPAEELFRKNFTVADITGALVADRSGWSITGGDYHSGSWPEVSTTARTPSCVRGEAPSCLR